MKNKLSIVLLSTMLCMLSATGYSMESLIPSEVASLVNSGIKNKQKFNNKLDSAIKHVDPSSGWNIMHCSGLNNRGNTCWIDSTIQLLANDFDFVLKLLKEVNKKYQSLLQTKKGVLVLELANIMAELVLGNNHSYSPDTFLKVLAICNPTLYKEGTAGEVKDLIQYITETMHTLLNNATTEISLVANDCNRVEVFEKFCKEFQSKHQSFISDDFWAMHTNVSKCSVCGIEKYNTQAYNQLIFPLEEVRQMKYKDDNAKLFSYATSPVDFGDCFTWNSRKELFTGDNQYWCNNCKKLTDTTYSTEIEYLPNTLIINLNRGKAKINNVKINIPKSFNSHDWTRLRDLDGEYYLAAVACHTGKSGLDGHWITYARISNNDNAWYQYNDAFVKSVNENYMEQVLNGTQKWSTGQSIDPCTLIYKKVESQNNNNQTQSNTANSNTANNNINQYGYNLNYNNSRYNNMYGMQGTYGYPNMMLYNNMNPYNNMQYNYGYQNSMSYNNMFNFNNNTFMKNNIGMNMNNNTMQYNNNFNNNGYNNNFNNINNNQMNNIINNNQEVMDDNANEQLLIDKDIDSLHKQINQTHQNKKNMTQQEGRDNFWIVQELKDNDFEIYDQDPRTYTSTLLTETIKLINEWNYKDNIGVYATFTKAWQHVLRHLQFPDNNQHYKDGITQEALYNKVFDLKRNFLSKYHICEDISNG